MSTKYDLIKEFDFLISCKLFRQFRLFLLILDRNLLLGRVIKKTGFQEELIEETTPIKGTLWEARKA